MNAASGILKFRLTPELIAKFTESRIYFSASDKQRLKVGQVVNCLADARIEPYVRFSAGNNLFSMGSYSYSRSELPTGIVLGRYCSIGASVRVMGRDHPTDRLSTSPFTYHSGIFQSAVDDLGSKGFTPLRRARAKPMPVVGNDVWVGEAVTLARGVHIGDGAIVAGHSVVTKDIPPYEIWGGCPARRIRSRFDSELVARLTALAWWQYSFTDFGPLPLDKPVGNSVEALEKMIIAGKLSKFEPHVIEVASFIKV